MPQFQTSIAVLPFQVKAKSAKDLLYLGEGLSEEIIQALSRIPQLKVCSRRSSFNPKLEELSLSEIGKTLAVNNLLEGSIELLGEAIKIRASLINVEDDHTFWSHSWQRAVEQLFELEDEISLEIADQLREQFGHLDIEDHLVQAQTENTEAFQYYLKAKYHFNRWNPKDVHLSINYFQKAIEIDKEYTDAHTGMADAYGFLATAGFADPIESWAKAKSAMDFVLVRKPSDPGLNYQLANYYFFVEASYSIAYKFGKQSIAEQLNYPEGQQFMAFLELLRGQYKEAKTYLHYALAIDPINPESRFYAAYFEYRSSNFSQAIKICEELLSENPQNLPALIVRYYALIASGQQEQAKKELSELPEAWIMPDERMGLSILCDVHGKQQDEYEGLSEYIQMAETNQSPQSHAYLYLIYARLGRNDEAFRLLEKLFEHKSSILLLNFNDPLAKPLQSDPRFPELLQRIYALNEDASIKAKAKKSSRLDLQEQAGLNTELEKLLKAEQIYLEPSLSLRSLAAKLQVHPNQLSWYLNEGLGSNFNDYINKHRLEHFKQLALNPANSHISLLGLAYESGFNSKSVFNASFKKHYGLTPSKYLAQLKN